MPEQLVHRPGCSETTAPTVWQGKSEPMQTCPECMRSAPATAEQEAAAESEPRRSRELVIPPVTTVYRNGWPTHKARRRNSRRRHYQENR